MTLPEYVTRVDATTYRIRVWIQPGAKKSQLAGPYQGSLKIRIQAPPVENKANRELIGFLARMLGVKPNRISLESGKTVRKKTILVHNAEPLAWKRLEGER